VRRFARCKPRKHRPERRGRQTSMIVSQARSMCPYGFRGLFVPKPSSRIAMLGNRVSSLGLSVRQRSLVCVGVRGDRHSVGHSAQPLGPTLACPQTGVQRTPAVAHWPEPSRPRGCLRSGVTQSDARACAGASGGLCSVVIDCVAVRMASGSAKCPARATESGVVPPVCETVVRGSRPARADTRFVPCCIRHGIRSRSARRARNCPMGLAVSDVTSGRRISTGTDVDESRRQNPVRSD
jgi:hypothetical protein